jgi:outer membrane protein, heavy metal efflux system
MKAQNRLRKHLDVSWIITSALALLLVNPDLRAQNLSIDSIISIIKDRNPTLKNYRQRADAMTTYAQGGKNWMAPEVGGGLWMLPYKKTEDPRDQGQIMLSVQQKFSGSGKLRASQGYLESKATIERSSEKYVFNELRAQAKTAYYQWIVLEKKKVVLKENEEIINLVLKVSKLRYPYNQSKLGNIYKAEARLNEVQNMILMNDNQIIQRNLQLNQLMNLHGDYRFSIDTLSQFEKPVDDSDTISLAEKRSDVQRIDKSIQSMKLNQALENAQSGPDFSISFNHMFARGAGMPNQFMLLGMVSIPIAPWSSKMYKANSQGLNREIEAMKNEKKALINELHSMAASEANEIATLRKQIENYKTRIVPALRKNYETLMISYEENKEELPVVIDAWEALNATQMQYLDTIQKYYETMVNYEKILERE